MFFELLILLALRYQPPFTTRVTASLISAPCRAVTSFNDKNGIIFNIYSLFYLRIYLYSNNYFLAHRHNILITKALDNLQFKKHPKKVLFLESIPF